jgi:hypothetical protein
MFDESEKMLLVHASLKEGRVGRNCCKEGLCYVGVCMGLLILNELS